MATSPVVIDPSDVQPHVDAADVQVDSPSMPTKTPTPGIGQYAGALGNELKGMGKEALGMVTSAAAIPGQDIIQGVQKIPAVYHAYETARQSGKGIIESARAADEVARQQDDARNLIKQRAKEFADNPSEATGKTIMDLIPIAMGFAKSGGPVPTEDTTPPPAEQPGIIKQLVKGKSVAQPGTAETVRSGVQASTETAGTASDALSQGIQQNPIAAPTEGKATLLDEPLQALKDKEATAYKQVDDTSGFDVKAEKQQLANDQYKMKQLGNTPEDMAAREKLARSVIDSQKRIAEAEAKLKAAGIDPKAADQLHQRRMAGQDFKKVLTKNTNADGSLNVDGLLKDSKTLRFNKNGDRLSQFMGVEASNQYLTKLSQMQKLGAHAVKVQAVAKWVGGGILGASAVEGGAKILK